MTEQEDKELPLREDIRLLGRLLGDTVREQEGPEAFETIERIGRSSIALAVECRHGDEVRVRMQQVIVTTSLDDGKAVPIADDIRAAITAFQQGVH